jgi:hypothetical protein
MTHSSEANFVAQVVKSTNAILGVFEVVILDEAKAGVNQLKLQGRGKGKLLTLCISLS